LKYKKFCELDIIAYLVPQVVDYIQSWTQLKDDPYYISYVIHTVRSLYTFIRAVLYPETHHHEKFVAPKPHQIVINQKPKGRDDIIRAITTLQIKTDYNNEAYKEVMKEVEIVSSSRSYNFLTGSKSRTQGSNTPQTKPGYDPFNTK
jgi:hypothetical protein